MSGSGEKHRTSRQSGKRASVGSLFHQDLHFVGPIGEYKTHCTKSEVFHEGFLQ